MSKPHAVLPLPGRARCDRRPWTCQQEDFIGGLPEAIRHAVVNQTVDGLKALSW